MTRDVTRDCSPTTTMHYCCYLVEKTASGHTLLDRVTIEVQDPSVEIKSIARGAIEQRFPGLPSIADLDLALYEVFQSNRSLQLDSYS